MEASHRWVARAALALVASAAWSVDSAAQSAARTGAPVAGTWGGEASVGDGQSASLLLFQTPQWALLAGGSIQSTSSSATFGGDVVTSNRFTLTSLRVGARRYARSGLGARPIAGLGLLIAGGTDLPTAVGGYGELGAAYFFNPHVSLGATAELGVTHRGSGSGSGSGRTSFGASLARLTGAVYF